MKFRDFLRILRAHGFEEVRQDGSHHIFRGTVDGHTKMVPVAYSREGDDIKSGTLSSMIRQSGLSKDLFR